MYINSKLASERQLDKKPKLMNLENYCKQAIAVVIKFDSVMVTNC